MDGVKLSPHSDSVCYASDVDAASQGPRVNAVNSDMISNCFVEMFRIDVSPLSGTVTSSGCDPNEVQANPYRGYRFPEEIISQCVWLYFNLSVSLREVELMMAYRGIQLSYETIRRWCDTFGSSLCGQTEAETTQVGRQMVFG